MWFHSLTFPYKPLYEGICLFSKKRLQNSGVSLPWSTSLTWSGALSCIYRSLMCLWASFKY